MPWLYFVQCNGRRGPVKIGYATDLDRRISNLQMANPYPLALIGACAVRDPAAVESALHERFAAQRMRGEWFGWSQELDDVALEYEARHADHISRVFAPG